MELHSPGGNYISQADAVLDGASLPSHSTLRLRKVNMQPVLIVMIDYLCGVAAPQALCFSIDAQSHWGTWSCSVQDRHSHASAAPKWRKQGNACFCLTEADSGRGCGQGRVQLLQPWICDPEDLLLPGLSHSALHHKDCRCFQFRINTVA